ILLDAEGQPHVTDFGLAKIIENGDDVTRTIALLGTPAYMSPEQAAGHARKVTTSADVYSLGAILYELLTGRPPFDGTTALETFRQTVEEEPVAPSELSQEVDPDLETICLTCLRKEPESRYGSALALAEDLERWLAHEPILARQAGALERLRSWRRRNPKTAILSASVFLLLLLVAVGSTLEVLRIKRANRAATEKLFESYLAQARALRRGGREGQRFESLDAALKAAAIHP